MFVKVYLIKSISAVTNYNSSSCLLDMEEVQRLCQFKLQRPQILGQVTMEVVAEVEAVDHLHVEVEVEEVVDVVEAVEVATVAVGRRRGKLSRNSLLNTRIKALQKQ